MRLIRSESSGGVGRLEDYRCDMLGKGGERVPVSLSAALIYDDGKPVASVGLFTDLRERLQMQERLAPAQQELRTREKQAIIAELAGAAAHELNQPLTSVMGYAELLKRRLDRDIAGLLRPLTSSSTKPSEWPKSCARSARSRSTRPRATSGAAKILDLDKASEETQPIDPSNRRGARDAVAPRPTGARVRRSSPAARSRYVPSMPSPRRSSRAPSRDPRDLARVPSARESVSSPSKKARSGRLDAGRRGRRHLPRLRFGLPLSDEATADAAKRSHLVRRSRRAASAKRARSTLARKQPASFPDMALRAGSPTGRASTPRCVYTSATSTTLPPARRHASDSFLPSGSPRCSGQCTAHHSSGDAPRGANRSSYEGKSSSPRSSPASGKSRPAWCTSSTTRSPRSSATPTTCGLKAERDAAIPTTSKGCAASARQPGGFSAFRAISWPMRARRSKPRRRSPSTRWSIRRSSSASMSSGRAAIDVERKFASDVRPVLGVRDQLTQVFVNLITNACHAMEPQRRDTLAPDRSSEMRGER